MSRRASPAPSLAGALWRESSAPDLSNTVELTLMVKAQVSQPQGVRVGEMSCPLQAAALVRVGHTLTGQHSGAGSGVVGRVR